MTRTSPNWGKYYERIIRNVQNGIWNTEEKSCLLYTSVHGNHDEKYDQTPPEGCICIDDKIYVHEGIRILGLGGCMPYKPGKYMYTEKEMKRRLLHIKHQLIFYRGFDILLTHAPAQGLGDGDDHAHQGLSLIHI